MVLKGITHVHSNHSYDGKLRLEEIRALCMKRGLQFACITEHADDFDQAKVQVLLDECARLSDEQFLFVPGFEVGFEWTHTLVIGVKDFTVDPDPLEMIRLAKEKGAWISLAHPHRNDFEVKQEHLRLLDAIEVWNSQYDGKRAPRNAAMRFYRKMFVSMPKLLVSAGWDFHRESHAGGPLLCIEASELSSEAIAQSLNQGAYTIERGFAHLSSEGKASFLRRLYMFVVSALSVGAVTFFKRMSSLLVKLGIPQPKRLKSLLRRWL